MAASSVETHWLARRTVSPFPCARALAQGFGGFQAPH